MLFILLGIIAIFYLSSCSSQKRLQRKIERHGIKESVGFVVNKYPEYFKSKDTVIHDTIIMLDSVMIPTIDTAIVLSDSSNFYHYKSDSLSILINKLTGRLELKIKPRVIYLHDTIITETKCPIIICPDCEDLKDNSIIPSNFPWWMLIVGAVLLLAFKIWLGKSK